MNLSFFVFYIYLSYRFLGINLVAVVLFFAMGYVFFSLLKHLLFFILLAALGMCLFSFKFKKTCARKANSDSVIDVEFESKE